MDEFTCHMYSWQCCACATKVTCARIGVNSLGELLATWFCIKCQKRVISRVPLEEIIAQVPPPPEKLLETTKNHSAEDAEFMKEMHITWPVD